jgi:hypothetical protein
LVAVAAVPFVPSLLLSAANVFSPTTVGGCVAVFAVLLVSFAALIPMYLLLRPYRWPCLNVACAANTALVLGLLALVIAELQGRAGVAVEYGIAVLLAAQSALAMATVALNAALLLLSGRMDPAKCLGDVVWTVQRWSPKCIERFLKTTKKGDAETLWIADRASPLVDRASPSEAKELPAFAPAELRCGASASVMLRRSNLPPIPLRGITAMLRGRETCGELEQRVTLALLVEAICMDHRR